MNIFQGDPRIILTADGATLQFVGGQPRMDTGLENQAIISLFTDGPWPGNDLFKNTDQKIGSRFEEAARQPVTLTMLNDVREAAEEALKNPIFGKVSVVVENPNFYRLNVEITIEPPGQDVIKLILEKNGLNWINQNLDPVNRRIDVS